MCRCPLKRRRFWAVTCRWRREARRGRSVGSPSAPISSSTRTKRIRASAGQWRPLRCPDSPFRWSMAPKTHPPRPFRRPLPHHPPLNVNMICFRAIFRRRVESHRGDLMLRHLAFVLKFFNLIFFFIWNERASISCRPSETFDSISWFLPFISFSLIQVLTGRVLVTNRSRRPARQTHPAAPFRNVIDPSKCHTSAKRTTFSRPLAMKPIDGFSFYKWPPGPIYRRQVKWRLRDPLFVISSFFKQMN